MSADKTTADAGKKLPLETAHYIAELTAEMSAMARRADLETIARLLDQARVEAERVIEDGIISD